MMAYPHYNQFIHLASKSRFQPFSFVQTGVMLNLIYPRCLCSLSSQIIYQIYLIVYYRINLVKGLAKRLTFMGCGRVNYRGLINWLSKLVLELKFCLLLCASLLCFPTPLDMLLFKGAVSS